MKTFPCIRGNIGDWTYYNTCIRMAELINYVKFAHEIFPRTDLDQVMQRELTTRSSDITKYLLNNKQRFMGSLIVAAVGGEPKFTPLSFGENVYAFAEGKLGFLNFDGSEKYYALDGQHRLAAIKEALETDAEKVSKDEVSVVIVWHKNNDDGRARARRLFTTINRYAKKTGKAEDLVFDEDNPADIYTRRMVREHDFFMARTKVTNLSRRGEFELITKSEALRPEDSYDRRFLLSLLTLKRSNELLLSNWAQEKSIEPQCLPDFDTLEDGYSTLIKRWDVLLSQVQVWNALGNAPESNLDASRRKDGGHPLARPIAIIAFIEASAKLLDAGGDIANIGKVASYFSDITAFPFKGLLWKNNGGMHDGQTRRKAAAILFTHYLTGTPDINEVRKRWEVAAGFAPEEDFPDRNSVLK